MKPQGDRGVGPSAPTTPIRGTSSLPPRFTDQPRPASPAPSLRLGPGAGGDVSWYQGALKKLGKQPEWPSDKEEALLEPYTYLSSVPGKEVRSALIDSFNHWLRVPQPQLESIKRVVRMLHTASLLMDDVEDNSTLRRGVPVAHKIYGIPQTINTANYVYFQVFDEIYSMGGETSSMSSVHPLLSQTALGSSSSSSSATARSLAVARVVTSELLHLHRGQGMDLLWRDSLTCPTEEEYVEMVNNKTGGLFRIALGLMCAWSPLFSNPNAAFQGDAAGPPPEAAPPPPELDLVPLANLIGLLFQIRDDYMNLNSETYADNKGFAEDLTEGKFSFPIIHAIRSAAMPTEHAALATAPPPNRQLLNILSQRPTDPSIKEYAVRQMRTETRSFVYTRNVLRVLDEQARREVVRVEQEVAKCWSTQAGDVQHGEAPPATNLGLLAILDALRKGWWEDLDNES